MKKIKVINRQKYGSGTAYSYCLNDLLDNLLFMKLITDIQYWRIKQHVFEQNVYSYKKGEISGTGCCDLLILEFQEIYLNRFSSWDLEKKLPKKALNSEYYIKFLIAIDNVDLYHRHNEIQKTNFELYDYTGFSVSPIAP